MVIKRIREEGISYNEAEREKVLLFLQRRSGQGCAKSAEQIFPYGKVKPEVGY